MVALTEEQQAFAERFGVFVQNAWRCIAYDIIVHGEPITNMEAVGYALDANRPSTWACTLYCIPNGPNEADELEKRYYGNEFSSEVKFAMCWYWAHNLDLPTVL